MYYSQRDTHYLTQENLLQDKDFIEDVYSFLKGRTGKTYDDPEEAYLDYVSLMRRASVNEVTAVKNYTYAKGATDEEKETLGRLYVTFDRMENKTGFGQLMKDYASGVVFAPSTASLLIPGVGAAGRAASYSAALGANAAAKALATKGIQEAAKKGTMRVAGIEASIGGGQALLEGLGREQAGLDQNLFARTAFGTLAGGVAGGVGGGIFAKIGVKQEMKTLGLLDQAEQAAVRSRLAAKAATKALKGEGAATKGGATAGELHAKIKKRLDLESLDDAAKAKGKEELDRIAKKLGLPAGTTINLAEDIIDNQASVVTELIQLLERNTGKAFDLDFTIGSKERISSVLARLLKDTDVRVSEKLAEFGTKYGLSGEQLASIFLEDISSHARAMWKRGQLWKMLKEGLGHRADPKEVKEAGKTVKELFDLTVLLTDVVPGWEKLATGVAELDAITKAGREIGEKFVTGGQYLRSLNTFRLSLMTVQPATTIRNTINAAGRMALYTLDNMALGLLTANPARMTAGLRAMKNITFSPSETRAFIAQYSQTNPISSQKLFRENMDVAVAVGGGSGLATLGRKLNLFNTYIDNAFKRTIFMAEASAQVGGQGNLITLLKANKLFDPNGGLFDKGGNLVTEGGKRIRGLDETQLKDAFTEALSFTYQKGFSVKDGKSNVADWFVNTFSHPVASIIIPFPRFLANMIEFTYSHSPIIGLASKETFTGGWRGGVAKRLAKQVTGTAMLAGAIQLRAEQGPEAKWWELYNQETGKFTNAMAIYGPFAPYMLAADIIMKGTFWGGKSGADFIFDKDGKTKERWEQVAKDSIVNSISSDTGFEFVKATFGTTFRTGVGYELVDGLQTDVQQFLEEGGRESKGGMGSLAGRAGARFAANYVNTFLIPAGAVRDLMGQLDPEYQIIRDTDDIDTGAMLLKNMLRSLPVKSVEDPDDPDAGRYFGWIMGPKGLGRKAMTAATSDVLRREEGLQKQVTGLTSPRTKNALQKELAILEIPEWKVFPKIRDPELDRMAKTYYQLYSERALIPLINSAEYQRIESPQIKKQYLKRAMGGLKTQVYDAMLRTLAQDLGGITDSDKKTTTEDQMLRLARIRWNEVSDEAKLTTKQLYPNLQFNTWQDYYIAIEASKAARRHISQTGPRLFGQRPRRRRRGSFSGLG